MQQNHRDGEGDAVFRTVHDDDDIGFEKWRNSKCKKGKEQGEKAKGVKKRKRKEGDPEPEFVFTPTAKKIKSKKPTKPTEDEAEDSEHECFDVVHPPVRGISRGTVATKDEPAKDVRVRWCVHPL